MLIHFQFNGFKTLSIVIKQELEIYTGILTASILTFISFLSFCVNGEGGGLDLNHLWYQVCSPHIEFLDQFLDPPRD